MARGDWCIISLDGGIFRAKLIHKSRGKFRIVDDNKNGIWDPGNFALKKQPEKVYFIPQKISIRQNFEKDLENIVLPK